LDVTDSAAASEQPAAASGNGRGRPRDEEFDRRILEAGFEELSRSGISHFSVAAVARRAGVAKGSIYLRWPTREQLIHSCAVQLVSEMNPPSGGSLAADLEHLAEQWAAAFGRPRAIEVLLRVDADRDDHPVLFERIFEDTQQAGNRIILQAIMDAKSRGEIADDISPSLVNRIFVGAMFVEALAHTPAGPVSTDFRRQLVEFLVGALGGDRSGHGGHSSHGVRNGSSRASLNSAQD
jgi:AcrR family transcriptional regulator